MTDNNSGLNIFLLLGGITLGIILLSEEPKRSHRNSRSLGKSSLRNRTDERTVSREPFSESVLNKNVVQDELLTNFSTESKISSRSTGTLSSGSERTSTNNLISIRPLSSELIKKYPPEYYTLNKKKQWQYRKNYTIIS